MRPMCCDLQTSGPRGLDPLSTLRFPTKGLSQGQGATEAEGTAIHQCPNSLCEPLGERLLLWEMNTSGPVSTSPGTCCVPGT